MSRRARALAAALALAATSCASKTALLDGAVQTANGAAAVVTAGHSTLKALDLAEQRACYVRPKLEVFPCIDAARAKSARAWAVYDALQKTWLAAATLITAGRASQRAGHPVDTDLVMSAVTEIIIAERAFAGALMATRDTP